MVETELDQITIATEAKFCAGMDTIIINEFLGNASMDIMLIPSWALPPSVTKSPSLVLAPLPPPLLCLRRAFLTLLILAPKFIQDKYYSNCARAKLSGLLPGEIGQCEYALGDTLD
ncbi:hypothetical protein BDP27DRAFT_1419078 [Rhodocollybia butyracea]|uniref:Uncharacterized protein n=1 Tax=Rhodocollybia butyracea TaxID=206335 RepID=A0A9P5PD38_9AGAR|nr:hypothetical protein BDP27DRAFT_1428750 [Rhodocollybia butyracea]KAF9071274.1 hypothetical protein BDP27DRAFT_1419078 [Rhodocollybia butyracea]